MRTQKQQPHLSKLITLAAAGTMAIGLAGCVGYPDPPPPNAQYHPGYYSYYDYPSSYYYYDGNGNRLRGGYSDDANLRYDAQDRSTWHSDDHNYHNRGDFDHWDY